MQPFLRTSIIVILPGAFLCLLAADTFVVDQARGKDSGIGNEADPFATVGKGVAALKPGDTLTVNAGVYREQITVTALGTAAAPILIRAAVGQRVVLSGGERITGWQTCTPEQAMGSAHAANIHWVDIDWQPTAFFEDGAEQDIARTPNEGWWPTVKADHTTVTDPKNLTQTTDVWKGSTLFFFRYKGVAQTRKKVTGFDPATSTLTLDAPLGSGKATYTAGSDRYRLENLVTLIDRPGEWAWTAQGESGARLFYWPKQQDIAKAVIEIPRRPRVFDLGATAYSTVQGFEIVHAAYPGRTPDAAVLNNCDNAVIGAGDSITITGCSIHHNGRFGIQGGGYKNLKIVRNLIYRNQYGIALSGQSGTLIENNEIADGTVDGLIISHKASDIMVRGNYIHHHNSMAHPDNIQMHNVTKNITFDSNLVVSAGQSVMMENCSQIVFRNNMFAGSAANMMIMGHGNATKGTWERNTFAMWTAALFSLTAQDYTISRNIMVNNGGTVFYGIPAKGEFSADHNLWFRAPGVTFQLGTINRQDAKAEKFNTLEELQKKSGQEKDSVMKDPEFKNAPVICTSLDAKKIGDNTRECLIVDAMGGQFKVGDAVEVHFDGVVRKVIAQEGETVTIDPPLAEAPDRVLLISNWKDKTEFTLDLASPFNDQHGSTINAPAYARGDFDGDGKRDIPEYH
ncbi:MAG: right-handed parallel beta-helix repeat-containing protein [Planctomycetota bacterium]